MKPKAVIWGAYGAILFVGVWTLAHFLGTTMPQGFAQMQPVAVLSVGFFWGAVVCMVRDRKAQ